MDFFPLIKERFSRTAFRSIELKNENEKPRLENGRLVVAPSFLKAVSEAAFTEIAFYLRETHIGLLAENYAASLPGSNERLVLGMLLENAVSASGKEFCLCQDTGTAVVYGWKSEGVYSGSSGREALEEGAEAAYRDNFLRASIAAPSSFFEEYNTGGNLPAQIRLESVPDNGNGPAYYLLFIAKGGGSSNKTSLFQMSKALLEEKAFDDFLLEKIPALGSSACPPYRLAIVIGGTSPELNLEAQKLAAAEILDGAPFFSEGNDADRDRREIKYIRRDRYWEERAMDIGRNCGIGAQAGGTSMLLDARVLRLPRHAASCPVSVGVSCAAHRNILVRIDQRGAAFEKLVHDPAAFLKARGIVLDQGEAGPGEGGAARVNLEKPLKEITAELSAYKSGARLSLSGRLLVARDAAHLKWHALIAAGKELPSYLFRFLIFYAGPAAAPPGRIIGSLGPTTAARMDPYAEELMSRGASLITLAKGNRAPAHKAACQKYGGFYLGTTGGAAALLAEKYVTSSEVIDYPELGMEAVRLITVKDFPAFMITSS